MKRITVFAAMVLSIEYCSSQDTEHGKHWTATVNVVDEAGQPIGGANVTIGYYVPPPEDETISMDSTKGSTDTNGFFRASGQTRSTDLFFGAEKEGYYRSHLDYELNILTRSNSVNWSPRVALILKKIVNPIPLYAKKVGSGPPVFNQPAGYDLTVGDWVAPLGKGVHTDMIFNGHLERKAEEDYDYRLTVSFPESGDGIQEFSLSKLERTSTLGSPHEAPLDGYRSGLLRTMSRHPGEGSKDDSDKNRNYFIRVRTVLDEKGNVKSALYGKIYGDFMQFRYYLNPTPNDRNVEFDPKQNLLKSLTPLEQVTQP